MMSITSITCGARRTPAAGDEGCRQTQRRIDHGVRGEGRGRRWIQGVRAAAHLALGLVHAGDVVEGEGAVQLGRLGSAGGRERLAKANKL